MAARRSGRNHAVKQKSLQNCKYKNAIETHIPSLWLEKKTRQFWHLKMGIFSRKRKRFHLRYKEKNGKKPQRIREKIKEI